MNQVSNFCEAVDENGVGLRVTFVSFGDRMAHTIAAVDGDRLTPLLASDEGTDQDEWPPSPPLQELTIESRGESSVGLLVGMAGTSHWSVSVEADNAKRQLIFDVACRFKSLPMFLGSGYRAMFSPTLDDDNIVIGEYAQLALAKSNDIAPAQINVASDGFQIGVNFAGTASPATVRWQYEITRSG